MLFSIVISSNHRFDDMKFESIFDYLYNFYHKLYLHYSRNYE